MFEGLKNKISGVIKGFVKKEEKEIEEKEEILEEKQESNEKKEEQDKISNEDKNNTKHNEEQESKKKEENDKKNKEEDNKKNKEEDNKAGSVGVAIDNKQTKKDFKLNLSLNTKIKKVFLNNIKLNDSDINQLLDNLKMSLLQSDVSYPTADKFIESLDTRLKNTAFNSKNISQQVTEQVRFSLLEILNKNIKNYIDLFALINKKIKERETPVKILFIGPNGTGKTTTIAKIAYNLKQKNISSVLSASDTFRAAAIEQTEYHANKVGVPVIKSRYGADPASVAFDAINYAKAHNISAVLIDSAGRQETNKNLINEMMKIVRVTKPDITIYVGESISGHIIADQINEFSKFIKIDGIILTKLDCDAKGGNAISIAYDTDIPILFIGTGEAYNALINYNPDSIANSIL
ncbi:MAG: signal recognition particle-docking protein FtsY [Candidatus Micrarchaeaceae archaeon]|nr:signal recognition particle-docking protein FtsY [Candidatus Marsarchaeota archaeon]